MPATAIPETEHLLPFIGLCRPGAKPCPGALRRHHSRKAGTGVRLVNGFTTKKIQRRQPDSQVDAFSLQYSLQADNFFRFLQRCQNSGHTAYLTNPHLVGQSKVLQAC